MKFGIGIRKRLSGAELYVIVYQISCVLPALYILIASGYMALFAKKGLFTVLFDLGMASVPRWEALALSLMYRLTSHESAVQLVLLGAALAFGLFAAKLLRGKYAAARNSRIVFACLIAADLVLRLLPFHFNIAFGFIAAAFGFLVRAACLVLIILDLRADKKAQAQTN